MLQSRFALPSVLRKPMSVSPSISRPSSTTKLPVAICSLSTCAGTLVEIHAGRVLGLKPSSSMLRPLSTAAKPSFTTPGALAVEPEGAGADAPKAEGAAVAAGCSVSGAKPEGLAAGAGANCIGACTVGCGERVAKAESPTGMAGGSGAPGSADGGAASFIADTKGEPNGMAGAPAASAGVEACAWDCGVKSWEIET